MAITAASVSKRWQPWQALIACLLWCWAGLALAHPMPETRVWIDTTPAGMNLTLQLPLNRLEFAFGQPLSEQPAQVLPRYADALSAYLLQHVGARSDGIGWQVLRPTLKVVGNDSSAELEAVFELHAPTDADVRSPTLLYDVINHEVRTHRALVFLRNDWHGGYAGQPPLLLGELRYGQNTLPITLQAAPAFASVRALLWGGAEHIAEGTDHLLFLLMLLLVAPLAAQGKRWSTLRPLKPALRHTALVITCFTIGHTITLVLGSTGLLVVPSQPVEVAVAVTIAIAALHAWRPLFANAEAWMALAFGLIHGMAFSASLSGAGLTIAQHAQALLAFNIGIELAQLAGLLIVLPPLLMLGHLRGELYGWLRRLLSVAAAVLALAWVSARAGLGEFEALSWLDEAGAVALIVPGIFWLLALLCYGQRRLAI
ncbi:HupE/UreJ family protein [Duganella sp. FT80W]|uniref:HupE/UreJ family protein n=1 Tax=Duganella guangzhouensis TaxID=2666084 RepID=A0A6I2L9P6_9BURK|nr:HupE/UreJ family protein [Duganella guangzhouensis]MRW94563.1 HupE/UreJ family protein [Duganella guangzhouensis]